MLKLAATAALVFGMASGVGAQVSLTSLGTPVTQNFDSLATSGTANVWSDNSTLSGWYAQFSATPANPTTYRADAGGSNAGAIYSWGTGTATERAFGSVSSGTPVNIYTSIRLVNNTGASISSLFISYNGEQWRDGGAAIPNAQFNTFQYQVAAAGVITDANTPNTGWTTEATLNFTSPTFTNTGAGAAVDGNAVANRTAISATLTFPTAVANGQEIWLRWEDINNGGNDHGLSIDDLSITPQAALPTATVVSINRTLGNPTNQTGLDWQIVFSSAISGLSASNLALVNGGLGGTQVVSVGPIGADPNTTWNVSVNTVIGNGTLGLNLTNDSGVSHDITNAPFTGEVFTVDQTAPTLNISIADNALTGGETTLVTFVFSEAVFGFDNADITVPNGTLSPVSSGDGGITWTATFTPTAGINDATNVFSVNMGGVNDIVANPGVGNTDSPNFSINTVLPNLSINNVTLNEGNVGITTFAFTVSLDAPAPVGGVTFDIATANGSATSSGAFADYVAQSLTNQTIPAGDSIYVFNVVVNGNLIPESNEVFAVNVTNVTGATIADGSGSGFITNDDVTGSISINDVTVTEGNSGPAIATFTVSLSAPAAQGNVRFDIATADGTAIAGSDYQSGGFFPAEIVEGETSIPFAVAVNGDTAVESDETFFVNLSNLDSINSGDLQGIGTITNDDVAVPNLTINDVSLSEGNAGTTTFSFTVNLSSPAPSGGVTFDIATASGTATSGTDFVANTLTSQTIPAGSSTYTFDVLVIGETQYGTNETFFVNVTNVTVANVTDGQGLGTINNDDVKPFISVPATSSVLEGNSGTSTHTVNVGITAAAETTLTMNWSTTDVSATAGSDYVAGSGTLTFVEGDVSEPINITINGDTTVEPNETFRLDLISLVGRGSEVNALQGGPSHTVTITNDDAAVPSATIVASPLSVSEDGVGNLSYSVALSSIATVDTTINLDFSGTANIANDYTGASPTVFVPTGEIVGVVTINPSTDFNVEPNETVVVSILPGTNYTVGSPSSATGTINNDDFPAISLNDVTQAEGDSGTTNFVFTVSLSEPAAQGGVTFSVNTTNGSATAGSDYTAFSASNLTIAEGLSSTTFSVVVNGDTSVEANETFNVSLSNVTGAIAGDFSGVGTITNDDVAPLPTISINDVTVLEGNAGTVIAQFLVSLSTNAPPGGVTFDFATADGTATAPADYVARNLTGQLIVAGNTGALITVTINGDTIDEADHTFLANITNVVGATIADGQGIGTIADDDLAPTWVFPQITSSVTEGNGGSTQHNVTVILSNSSESNLSLRCVTFNDGVDDTATDGSDYTGTDVNLSFNAGTTTQFFTVPILGDTTVEPNETFSVGCYGFGNRAPTGLPPVEHTVTINNDDAAVIPLATVAVAPTSVLENSGNALVYTVTLTPAPTADTAVAFTLGGTATSGTDYPTPTLTANFAPAQTEATVSITPTGDTFVEADETIVLTLVDGGNYDLGATTSATGTVTNDDSFPTLTLVSRSAPEGNVNSTIQIQVNLSAPYPEIQESTCYAFVDTGNTATEAADFLVNPVVYSIPANATSFTFPVTIVGDTLVEANETFSIGCYPPRLPLRTPAGFPPVGGVVTIIDDDSAADLSFTSFTDSPDPVAPGGTITYTLVVNNAGPSSASNASMSFTLPAGLTFVSATGAGWTCSNVVVCSIASLPVGSSTITITATVPAGATAGTIYSSTANITSATSDPTPGANAAPASTTVASGPILQAEPVPSLNDWARILMLTVLTLVGWMTLRRRQFN